jgi:nucleoside-diphosphate-sugar epimerase/pimeloyl-ACP methyl ester carboxylesterase
MSHTLVTGATGLIGRWLVPELTRLGRDVVAIVRRASERRAEYAAWVTGHGGDAARVTLIEGDLAAPALGLDDEGRRIVAASRDVFHCAALMQFGMSAEVGRRANVGGTRTLLELVATPALRRFVLVTGFKGGDDVSQRELGYDPEGPYDAARYDSLYTRVGVYEATKLETDHLVRDFARTRGISIARVHPGSVIGDSRTGETTQMFGFAPLVEKLWFGKLPAVPGKTKHWLPLVSVDFLAQFMAHVADHPGNYIVLDDSGPQLAEMFSRIAQRIGMRAPHRRVPLGIAKLVLSKEEVEGMSFLGDRRYDTSDTRRLAAQLGLAWPAIGDAIDRTVDFLIASRFGRQTAAPDAQLERVAGAPVFVVGDRRNADVVMLHGLPLDGDSWLPVAGKLAGSHVRVDLPGLGRSAAGIASPLEWMESLLGEAAGRQLIIGHSLGTRYALEYAAAHRDRVRGLVLIAPYFLQATPPAIMRRVPIARLAARGLRRRHIEALVARDARAKTAVLDGPAEHLRRPGARARFGEHLALAHQARGALQQELRELAKQLPVLVIAGERDPLVEAAGDAEVLVLPGTGHFPQLDLPAEVAAAITRYSENTKWGLPPSSGIAQANFITPSGECHDSPKPVDLPTPPRPNSSTIIPAS